MKAAILIDGGFFIKRYRSLIGNNPPAKVAKDLHEMCLQYVNPRNSISNKNNTLPNVEPD